MNKLLICLVVLMTLLISCNTSKKIIYIQDAVIDQPQKFDEMLGITTIQPEDMLMIIVSSKNPELAVPFNLPYISGQISGSNIMANNSALGYVVNADGNIDFPILGVLHVSGLTRDQLSKMIKQKLIDGNYAKDAVVTVDFMNMYISVLGEVNKPGKIDIVKDKITLLDAISQAGDLTIYGKRNDVAVIREVDGKRTIYRVDLRSADLFASPVYYLQQNDVVYVEPNKVRAGQSTVNANNLRSVTLWTSITSLLVTICVLIFK